MLGVQASPNYICLKTKKNLYGRIYGTDDYGLKKIVTKHPEVLDGLQETVAETTVISKSENRIVLESELHKVVVSKMLGDCTTNPWILTAYKKKGAPASSSDIEAEP